MEVCGQRMRGVGEGEEEKCEGDGSSMKPLASFKP